MPKTRTTLYLIREEWNQFKEICDREGESASEKVNDFIRQYNLAHGHGNPQLTLRTFVNMKALPVIRIPNVLCDYIQAVTKDREILCRKRGAEYHSQQDCASCEFNRLVTK